MRAGEVAFQVDATLRDATLARAWRGLALTSGELDLAGDDREIRASGSVGLGEVPGQLRWAERLAPGSAWRRQIAFESRLDAEAAGRLGLPWPTAGLDGAMGVAVSVVEPRRGARRIALDLDLTPMRIRLPALGLDKPQGVEGQRRSRPASPIRRAPRSTGSRSASRGSSSRLRARPASRRSTGSGSRRRRLRAAASSQARSPGRTG